MTQVIVNPTTMRSRWLLLLYVNVISVMKIKDHLLIIHYKQQWQHEHKSEHIHIVILNH